MEDGEESVVGTLPPPRKSDVLFRTGEDWQANACIHGLDEAMAYQDGYRRAAHKLAEYVCDTGQGQDYLIFPIVYLYRHHIELTLKSIISEVSFVVDYTLTEKDIDILGRHDLVKLWNLAKPLLNPACELGGSSNLPTDDVEGIQSYILQLHKYDPDGQRFRYATTKAKGMRLRRLPSLPEELRHINIRDFAIALEKLSDYLDCLDMWFGDLIDAKIEFQASRARNEF
jgi:hypothetical protein